jgi:hypothetical protein
MRFSSLGLDKRSARPPSEPSLEVLSGGRGKLGIRLGLSRFSLAARRRRRRSIRSRRALSSSEGLDHSPILYI